MSSLSMAHRFKNRFSKKIVGCPNCAQKLRFPIRPGKVLRVSCNSCHVQFDVNFKSPVSEVFQWSKGYSMAHNMRFMMTRFKSLPMNAKASVFLFLLVVMIIIDFLISGATTYFNSPQLEESKNAQDVVIRHI